MFVVDQSDLSQHVRLGRRSSRVAWCAALHATHLFRQAQLLAAHGTVGYSTNGPPLVPQEPVVERGGMRCSRGNAWVCVTPRRRVLTVESRPCELRAADRGHGRSGTLCTEGSLRILGTVCR